VIHSIVRPAEINSWGKITSSFRRRQSIEHEDEHEHETRLGRR
jgi:hypothetical protein